MKKTGLFILFVFVFTVLLVSGQEKKTASAQEIKDELVKMAVLAEKKLISLAQAVPEEKMAWRPKKGIRSFSEVNMHIAGTMFWSVLYLGYEIPKDVPITKEYKTTVVYEKNKSKVQVINILKTSFKVFSEMIKKIPADKYLQIREYFGTKGTLQSFIFFMINHNHEHMGQLIAYARVNNIKPPWSK